MHHHTARSTMLAIVVLLVAGCNATRVDSVWKAPSFARYEGKKLLVVAPYPDGAIRRMAEDAMRSAIPGIATVASYEIIAKGSDLTDIDRVISAAKSSESDVVLSIRLVDDRSEIHTTSATPYTVTHVGMRGYWGPHRGLSSMYITAEQISSTRIVALELCLHRVDDGRLLWTALTSTRNPASVQELVAACITAARERLVVDGVLAAPAER